MEFPYLWEPGDALYGDRTALAQLVKQLVDLRLPMALSRLPEGSLTVTLLAEAVGRRGYLRQRPAVGSPGLNFSGTSDDPEQLLNSGRRSDLRRARRRAERLGELSFEFLTPTPEAVPELLAEACRVEAASWEDRGRYRPGHRRPTGQLHVPVPAAGRS